MKRIVKKTAAALLAFTLTAAVFSGCGSTASSAASADATAESTFAAGAEGGELEKVKAAGKLVIGVEGTYPPFTYHDDSIQTPEDLKGKKIATNATNAFIPWYEAQGAEIIGIDTSSEAIDLVLSGRADFLGTSVPVLNAYLDEHPDAKDKLKEAFVIPDSEDVIAIPVRKGETEYLDAINAALVELREEGKLKEISEKYLGGDYTESAYQ